MSQNDNNSNADNKVTKPQLVVSAGDYFFENLSIGFSERRIKIMPEVVSYLAQMLNYYIYTQNFFDEEVNESGQRTPKTLAEQFLLAQTLELPLKQELLKKLGDRTLYVSGFFADSLNRSLVDLDYYKNMGTTAYSTLSSIIKDEPVSKMFGVMSSKFTQIADVLTLISQQSATNSDQNILRLYESYLKTGSELAKEKLTHLGVLTVSNKTNKKLITEQ